MCSSETPICWITSCVATRTDMMLEKEKEETERETGELRMTVSRGLLFERLWRPQSFLSCHTSWHAYVAASKAFGVPPQKEHKQSSQTGGHTVKPG